MELTKKNFGTLIKNLKHWNGSDEGINSHGTANPIFDVQEKVKVYGFEQGYSDKHAFIHESTDEHESVKEFLEAFDSDDLKSLCESANLESVEEFLKVDESMQLHFLKNAGYGLEKVFYKEEWKHVNTHLTREGAEAFIKRKQHDYGELRIYVSSLYWCWEFNMIIKGLLSGKISLIEPQTPLKRSDFIYFARSEEENEAFPEGFKICLEGEYLHKNGKNGFLNSFDFELNSIGVYMGDGFEWKGTGQEFKEQWTKL